MLSSTRKMDPGLLTALLAPSCKATAMDRNPEYNPDMVGILPITRMTYGHPARLHGNDKPYLEA